MGQIGPVNVGIFGGGSFRKMKSYLVLIEQQQVKINGIMGQIPMVTQDFLLVLEII